MKKIAILSLILASLGAKATDWITQQTAISQDKIYENISPKGTAKGIIVASPSHQDPDYYFHWIRDSALVIDALNLYPSSKSEKAFEDYVNLSKDLQETPKLTGLGEPRFNIDGTAYMGDWARPQNDGPALRVLTLLRAPHHASEKINKIIEDDLNYINKNFNEPSYDLWEEVKGDHFYTKLVQYAAVKMGFEKYNEKWNVPRYDLQRTIFFLEKSLNEHWSDDSKIFKATLHRLQGAENYKHTDLDMAIVLGVLHAGLNGNKFSVRDDRVLSTATQLEDIFERIYSINKLPFAIAPAIGRYEGDVYFGGNPWYITTAAFAELNYKLANSLKENSNFNVTKLNLEFLRKANPNLKVGTNFSESKNELEKICQGLKKRGDQYLARIQLHTPENGTMAEQFDKNDAHPVSARDLTWSYASFLSAVRAREVLQP